MKKKIVTIIFIMLGLMFFLKFKKTLSVDKNDFYEKTIINFYNDEFKGIISEKFIDKNNHYSKTIILTKNDKQKTIFLDYENPMLFNYLQKGDSIIKYKKQKRILLKREGKDSIIKLKFDNYKFHNSYKNNIDSIISNKKKEQSTPDGASTMSLS